MYPLSHILPHNARVLTCDMKKTGQKQLPISEAVNALNETPPENLLRSHFCINPIGLENHNLANGGTSWRAQSNLAAYVNWLLESDTIPIEIQKQLILDLASVLPIALVVWSGGKSLHCFISAAEFVNLGKPGSPEATLKYKQVWEGIHGIADKFARAWLSERGFAVPDSIFDDSGKNPATLARMPNGRRENGNIQEVVYVGNLCSSEFLESFLYETQSSPQKTEVPAVASMSLEKFEKILNRPQHYGLRSVMYLPLTWAKSANNYKKILRYTFWCVEKTGVPYPTLAEFFNRYITPSLKSIGYQSDPLLPVRHVYIKKNRPFNTFPRSKK